MAQTQAVWLLVGLAILTAGMPFWLQRPLVCLPWNKGVLPNGRLWQRLLLSVLHLVLLAVWGWAALAWLGDSLAASASAVLLRLLVLLAALLVLLWWPGHQWRAQRSKSFVSRLCETLVLYLLIGVLGLAFESQLGNPFAQGWEFYAITLCLYLVLAFPGFVYRYLYSLRHARSA